MKGERGFMRRFYRLVVLPGCLVAEAVAAVRKLGLSGLLLDFEHLRDSTGEGRSGLAARYVRFLETVRAELDRALPPGSGGGRLVLGLSLSAHQWVLDRQGKVVRTYTPLLETVYRSIQQRSGPGEQAGTVRFDPVAHLPVFGYVRDEGQYEENVVWYEDARSMRAKMAIVHRYGLAGVSLWRLGIIPEVLWNDLLGPRPAGR
ncbi:MAG: hypothetical protein H5U04_03570 [Firmicutes bacterium]|nr:hypothetical protein [Bacillota bacterium]